MQKELCFILANKLLGLPFVQVLAGMVQTVQREEHNQDNVVSISRQPVATDTNILECEGPEKSLTPDSSRASIIYFEDYGITTIGTRGKMNIYNSSVRLVAWINKEKLYSEPTPGNVTGPMIAAIIERLENGNPINVGIFQRLLVRMVRIPPQDAAIFGRYTYNEVEKQYLRPPFDFFAIDLKCTFEVNPKCITP